MTDRATGVKLRLLDTDLILGLAKEETGTDYSIGFAPYAVATHCGHLYVICNEGVGWEVTEDKPLELELYAKKPNSIGMVSKLSPAEVRAYTLTQPEVDLADHIRSFGSRLESNFWMWHRTLTAARTQEV